MKMIEFYRFEDKEGNGPWYFEDALDPNRPFSREYTIEQTVSGRWPTAPNSVMYSKIFSVYGFLSAEQCQQWFSPKEVETLRVRGYKLKHAKVPEDSLIWHDKIQAVIHEEPWRSATKHVHTKASAAHV